MAPPTLDARVPDRGGLLFTKTVGRVLSTALVATPLALVASASPAAAITCGPGDTVEVKVLATPQTVPSGGEVTVEFKAFNCSAATESVTVISKRLAPAPCSNGSSTDAMTFAPHQRIKNTLAYVPPCPGHWRWTLVVFQGDTRVSKSWADFTAL